VNHLKLAAKNHAVLVAIFIVTGIVWFFSLNFVPFYFQTVVDNFTDGTLTVSHIAVYGTALIFMYLMGYLYNYPERKLEQSLVQSLKLAALRKVSVIDYLAFTKLGTGTLIQRIENGSAAGQSILSFCLRLVSDSLPAMIFSLIFVSAINRTVMATILFGYVVVFIISNLLLKALYRVKERILVNEEKFNHFLVRGFMEMVVFRVNRRFSREIAKTRAASAEIVASTVKVRMVHEAFFTIFAILVGFIKIGIIVYGWAAGALTIGQVVALVMLVDNAYQPIAIFNVDYIQYKLDRVAFGRYAEFLDAREDLRLVRGAVVRDLEGGAAFSRVSFSYDGREIFRDFSLEIPRGATVAFVGESGSGKSTAVKLLAGLLSPNGGSVSAGGFELASVDLNSYYEHIAYLPQEASIFDGTLRENLVFDDEVDEGYLMEAVRAVGLDELFSKLEKGFETPLGERGVMLSGGERQQLALARLWFSSARIVILDEATSAIDNLTEESVMRNVLELLQGRTVISVAHRLDSIRDFGEIVVFSDGCVVEKGGYDELVGRGEWFFELLRQ